MNVSVVIPTRGDVDLKPILKSLPEEWDVVVYDNGRGGVFKRVAGSLLARVVTGKGELPDLSVYARYAAIEYAEHDLILTQDDDCVVSDPKAIVNEWNATTHFNIRQYPGYPYDNHVVCNMPAAFRARHFYDDHSLVGFGAAFHRDAPSKAFARFFAAMGATLSDYRETIAALGMAAEFGFKTTADFFRTCDIVFTGLTPRVLVDIEYEDMPWASADNRMWKQSWHQQIRDEMRALMLEVRDGK